MSIRLKNPGGNQPIGFRELFKNPASEFRAYPYWAWNGPLDEEEISRQIQNYKKMGCAGFSISIFPGLKLRYLGEEWFKKIAFCCEEAEKAGMRVFLPDEDRWPPGFAGGFATKEPRFRQKRLQMNILTPDEFQWSDDILSAFTARISGQVAASVKRISPGWKATDAPSGSSIIIFRMFEAPKSGQFNDGTYLDTLSYEAVQEFISITHEQYKKRFGDKFGKTIQGFFTDEPYHESTCEQLGFWQPIKTCTPTSTQVPWTPSFPETFLKRYGYDILDHLPAVFFDIEGEKISRARQHYHDCRTFLFTDATARQLGEWCGKNGVMYTGHVIFESPLSFQASYMGSVMRFYEHMQAPGIDWLTDCYASNNYRPEYDTPKQCASVVSQCGKQWMLSELYGVTSWEFTFEGNKSGGNGQAALGVNLRNLMSWLSAEGQGKRNYPMSIISQSPWWHKYSVVEDYFARVSTFISQGSAVRRLLIVHPMESMWQTIKWKWRETAEFKKLDEQMMDLSEWLLEAQIDFDYGDEEMLSRLASVKEVDGRPVFAVGEATYDQILFPPLLTVRQSTLELAKKWTEAGGKVVFAGEPPEYVSGEKSPAARQIAQQAVKAKFERSDILRVLESIRTVAISGPKKSPYSNLLYSMRKDEEGNRFVFICNMDRKNGYEDVKIEIFPGNSTVEEWDAETGQFYSTHCETTPDKVAVKTDFAASGSRLFVLPVKPSPSLPARIKLKPVRREALEGSWDYSLSEPNVFVLDTPSYQIDGGPWNAPKEFLRIDNEVRKKLGHTSRSIMSKAQPWARAPQETPEKTCHIELLYKFEIGELPETSVQLAIEKAGRFTIHLNNTLLETSHDAGWWMDKSIRLYSLERSRLKMGENTLALAIDYGYDDGLELVHFLGEFGVQLKKTTPVMIRKPQKLNIGNWVEQSLPFYSGAVRYQKQIPKPASASERVFIELPEFAGTCVDIIVNGRSQKIIAWPPYEADITDALDRKENDLTIEVYSHRRNSFGPLHLVGDGPRRGWTGPNEFVTEGEFWQDEYHLIPCGLLKAPLLSYRQEVKR